MPTKEQWEEIVRLAELTQKTKSLEAVGRLLAEIGVIYNNPHAQEFWNNNRLAR